jgi:CO dehydrogenase maturation factor
MMSTSSAAVRGTAAAQSYTIVSNRADRVGARKPAAGADDVTQTLRIAIAGKGGSGKTTISGTLARLLAQAGRAVVAVDADTNPNLASTLGIDPDRARVVTALPRTLLRRETQPDGSTQSTFVRDPMEVLDEYGAPGPDGVRLVVMGAVGHGGAG